MKSNNTRKQEYAKEVLPHLNTLQQAARNLTSNQMDAQDLVQDTLLKAYLFWDSYETGSNCRAWLYRIMRNIFITEHRVRSRRPTMVDLDGLHDSDFLFANERNLSPPSPEDILQANQVRLRVAAALARIRREFRQTLLLHYWRGLSYGDIASVAGLPLSTVKARMYRGRQLLRRQIGYGRL